MKFLRAVTARPAREERDATFTLKDPAIQILRDWFGASGTAAGVSVGPAQAEGVPIVLACVSLLADLIAAVPMKVYRRTKGGKEPDPSNDLYEILHDLSNANMTAFEFRQTMQYSLGLHGNAYAYIERYPGGDVKALWPLQADTVKVDCDGVGKPVTYTRGSGPGQDVWTFNDARPPVLHLRWLPKDGIHGRAPWQIVRESLAEGIAARQVSASMFTNGMLGTVWASHPMKLKDTARKNLTESIRQMFSRGTATAHAVGVLEEGVKLERLSMVPKDVQFSELRAQFTEEMARAYRIPAFLVNIPNQTGTYGVGIEQQVLGFTKFTLAPWMQCWAQACRRDLLTRKTWTTHEVLFVTDALVQTDINTRTQAYDRQIKCGMLSPNEARELEDRNPREGGDEFVSIEAIGSGGNINRQPKQDSPGDEGSAPAQDTSDGAAAA